MQVVLDFFAVFVEPIVQIVGVDPSATWAGVGNLDLSGSDDVPVGDFFIVDGKVTQTPDHKVDIVAAQVIRKLID